MAQLPRQAVQQRAHGAQQEEPQQHAKATAQCGVSCRFTEICRIPRNRFAIVAQSLRSGFATALIGCLEDGFQIGLEGVWAEREQQHDQCKSKQQQILQRQHVQHPDHQGAQRDGHEYGKQHAAHPGGVGQLIHPAPKAGVAAPMGELRLQVQQSEGDERGKQANGHENELRWMNALYASDGSVFRSWVSRSSSRRRPDAARSAQNARRMAPKG